MKLPPTSTPLSPKYLHFPNTLSHSYLQHPKPTKTQNQSIQWNNKNHFIPNMSTSTTTTPSPTSIIFSNPPPAISQNLSTLGLGYSIAIAFAFLVLLSTILLASYVCCRATTTRYNNSNNVTTSSSSNNGIIVPRFVFVDDNEENNNDNNLSSTVGLDQAVINSYPKFTFSKTQLVHRSAGDLEASCSICLCDYREAEMLRMMPDCRHFFHLTCLDAWLKLNGSCPVCRNSPLPTPISTPLAEVVPLAQFAADRARNV